LVDELIEFVELGLEALTEGIVRREGGELLRELGFAGAGFGDSYCGLISGGLEVGCVLGAASEEEREDEEEGERG